MYHGGKTRWLLAPVPVPVPVVVFELACEWSRLLVPVAERLGKSALCASATGAVAIATCARASASSGERA